MAESAFVMGKLDQGGILDPENCFLIQTFDHAKRIEVDDSLFFRRRFMGKVGFILAGRVFCHVTLSKGQFCSASGFF